MERHTMYSFVWLSITFARFKLFHVPIVHFYYCMAFKVMNILHFTHSTILKHLVCLNLGDIFIILLRIFLYGHICIFLSGVAWLCQKICLCSAVVRFHQAHFQSGCIDLHFSQQRMKVYESSNRSMSSPTLGIVTLPFWSCGWVCSDIIFFSLPV